MKGKVFDIKKFAIHDGPGIRSTLFLKGCPLKCSWCHNPEGIDRDEGLWFFDRKCIRCGSCLEVCPSEALSSHDGEAAFISIDRDKCIKCGKCTEACPTTALTFDSSEMTVEEAVEKLMQDQPFYGESEGGVTISGGDPLFQHQFSREVLSLCKEQGVHTAIETSMQTTAEILDSFIGLVDLFIVDLKLMHDESHREHIGTGNQLILSNFARLVEKGADLLVRIPLIPGITASEENLRAVARYVKEQSSSVPIELINFNPLAENKYRLMGKEYAWLSKLKPFSSKELDVFYGILEEEGVPVVRETELNKS